MNLLAIFQGIQAISAVMKAKKSVTIAKVVTAELDKETMPVDIKNHIIEKSLEEPKEKHFWQSKKYITTVIAVIVPILNKVFGWELNITEVSLILAPFIVYVLSQGFADFGKNKKKD